jgi:murein DD-endopeptidase MepM/ murein hydrolase activator NlpD
MPAGSGTRAERGRHRRQVATQPAVVYAPALVLCGAVALPAVFGAGPAAARSAGQAMASVAGASSVVDASRVSGTVRAERALQSLPSDPTTPAPSAQPQRRPAWVRPDVGPLSSGYGYRPSLGDFHPGIDLAGPYGSPIRAAADGRIIFAGPASGFGQEIRIAHAGGIVTVYGHMSRILVSHGRVKAGEIIALEGSEGRSTGPHLHFEVWVRGQRVDPAVFLRAHGVRV